MLTKLLLTFASLIVCLQVAVACKGILNNLQRRPREGDDPDKIYKGQLGEVVSTEARTTPTVLIDKFNNYGCYCGTGGVGLPRDNIDQCCKTHDECYVNVVELSGRSGFWLYFYQYKYKYSFEQNKAICVDEDKGRKAKCECDAALGRCYRLYWDEWCRAYKSMDRSKCLAPPDPLCRKSPQDTCQTASGSADRITG